MIMDPVQVPCVSHAINYYPYSILNVWQILQFQGGCNLGKKEKNKMYIDRSSVVAPFNTHKLIKLSPMSNWTVSILSTNVAHTKKLNFNSSMSLKSHMQKDITKQVRNN